PFSKLKTDFDVIWMPAAEMYFLRAEGAIRNWNMQGTAKDLYETGVKKSFEQWAVTGADTYLANEVARAVNYTDPISASNNYSGTQISSITIKWNDASNFENKLERIL